jgi:vacuolar-type H+-ATPase subunit H
MPAPTTDRTVADAIDRVLEAEQAVARAIEAAEAEAQSTIDVARETRRRILETARRRAMRLHERAQTRIASRIERLEPATPAEALDASAQHAVAAAVLGAVAARLTTDDST